MCKNANRETKPGNMRLEEWNVIGTLHAWRAMRWLEVMMMRSKDSRLSADGSCIQYDVSVLLDFDAHWIVV